METGQDNAGIVESNKMHIQESFEECDWIFHKFSPSRLVLVGYIYYRRYSVLRLEHLICMQSIP